MKHNKSKYTSLASKDRKKLDRLLYFSYKQRLDREILYLQLTIPDHRTQLTELIHQLLSNTDDHLRTVMAADLAPRRDRSIGFHFTSPYAEGANISVDFNVSGDWKSKAWSAFFNVARTKSEPRVLEKYKLNVPVNLLP